MMKPLFSFELLEYLSSSSGNALPWNPATSLIVVDQVIKFMPDPDKQHDRMIRMIGCLNDLAEKHNSLMFDLCGYNGYNRRKELVAEKIYTEQEIMIIFINSLIPEMQQFFKVVPKLQDLSGGEDESLAQNQILAGFMVFLIQILDSERTKWSSFRNKSSKPLQEKLTFLLTILGDTPFWYCTDDVNNLLVEDFEPLAEEAGSFIYSCIFAPTKMTNKKFNAGVQSLLKKMCTFLNEEKMRKIIKKEKHSSFKLLELPKMATSKSIPSLHSSLFIIDSLVEYLDGLMNGRSDEIKDQIKTLIDELALVQTVLKDIQMLLQFTHVNNEVMKEPLIQIREVAAEAEYLINTHVMGRIPTWYLNLRLPDIFHKVKLNGRRLEEIIKIYDVKDIKEINNGFTFTRVVRNPEVVVESVVMGFEDNRTKILADLVGGFEKLQTISIFGMPGIGKTTIAKKLYNDRSVVDNFDLCVWCVVSQTYDINTVLDDILTSLASKLGKNKISHVGDESSGLEIYQSLKGRRYLIILDDVWLSSTWDDLRIYFPDDGNRSRILLTSRIKDIAPSDSIFHAPPLLTESQCCDLLVNKVFIEEPCPPELLGIAKRIASKCHGLPLAVVVVAGIVANLGNEESAWKNVETNLDSYISDDPSKYMKILELSYEHLPDHLKPCFLYLGAFPEDKEIPIRKLIPLWIAEGFVHKKEEKNLEHAAEEYFIDLINRSLLMIAKRKSDGGIKACSIHDLLRDMCLRRSEEEKFLKHINMSTICQQHSHLVLHDAPKATFAALHCRSLTGNDSPLGYYVSHMPLLRVIDGLSLRYSCSMHEMTRIYSLVHLKYLSLSLLEFPTRICMLVNLEYIHLAFGSYIVVPSTILKMDKLKHVCITAAAAFEKNRGSSKIMNNLKSLSYVLLRSEEEKEILKCFPHLHKLKCICDGLSFPDLSLTLTEIESLTLKFTSPPKGELTQTNFPSTLKKLSLYRIGLPWEKMSVIGELPNLHVLKLFCCAFVGTEWETIDGEFPELRFLRLEDVSLVQWTTSSQHFPKLQHLVLAFVRDLVEVPCELGNIPSLETIEVRHCGHGINRSAVWIEEEQQEYGNEDLQIIITSDNWSKDQLVQQVEQDKIDQEDEDETRDTGVKPEEIDYEYEDETRETGVKPEDIKLVMDQAWVSRTRAIKALKGADGDVVSAIMELI